MDFFAAQDEAKARTRRFYLLFGLAVLFISALLTAAILLLIVSHGVSEGEASVLAANPFTSPMLSKISIGVFCSSLLFFSATSLIHYVSVLRGGGQAIAEGLRGRIVEPGTRNETDRLLVNCVEEMSIASGVPLPKVYVIPDDNINAFAAGFSVEDTVVAVTEGALKKLNRNELQGIIAHEFSHILCGDVVINAKMLGILFSMEVLTAVGRYGLRNLRTSGSKRKGEGGAVFLFLAFLIVGSLGFFLSSLIKAAINRQREFLADASAVQFTRNPAGIGNALLKASGNGKGQFTGNMHHMLFVKQIDSFFGSLARTHPPVKSRLRALFPGQSFEGVTDTSELSGPNHFVANPKLERKTLKVKVKEPTLKFTSVGAGSWLTEASESYSSVALMLAIFISEDFPAIRRTQLLFLKEQMSADHFRYMCEKSIRQLWELDLNARYKIFQVSVNTITQLSFLQRKEMVRLIEYLIQVDRHIDLYEFGLLKILREKLRIERDPVRHRLSDKHIIRKFLNFFCRQIVDKKSFEILQKQVMVLGVDIGLNNPVDTPEEVYHLLLSMDDMSSKGKKALAQLIAIIMQSKHVKHVANAKSLAMIVLNAIHIPSSELNQFELNT